MATEKEPLLSDAAQNGREIHSVNAIEIRSLTHNFGDFQVMQGLEMTVPRGSIYGLLGPSGCGKTTLLKMILGQVVQDEGTIRVLGEVPGESKIIPGSSIGYAPQEIALYNELSIYETLRFFSRLHGMNFDAFTKRKQWLIEFLDLPVETRLVKQLSGGQKRRLSLAAALLHDPDLLILDEPTVGVDPELRARIWAYLKDIARSGVTIVITTHYIEEAVSSDRVGLMRKGRLLAEDSPSALMRKYDLATLEEVFLELCKRDANDHHHRHKSPHNQHHHEHVASSSEEKVSSSAAPVNHVNVNGEEGVMDPKRKNSELRRLASQHKIKARYRDQWFASFFIGLAIFWRKLTSLRKDFRTCALAIINPSLQICMMALAIGNNPRHLPFAVINQDSGFSYSNISMNLGSAYVSELQTNYTETFELKNFTDLGSAIDAVRKGDLWGVAFIGANFSSALASEKCSCLLPQYSPDQGQVQLYMDLSNSQVSTMIELTLTSAFEAAAAKVSGTNETSPILIKQAVFGSLKAKFIDFLAPGMLAMICFTASLVLTAVTFTTERTTMTLDRVLASGASPFEIVWGNQLGFTVLFLIQQGILLLISFVGFKLPLHGSIFPILAIIFTLGVFAMSWGMLIASTASGEFEAIQSSVSLIFPLQILSGVIWPNQAMPRWLYIISLCLPTTWAADALRDVMVKGWGLSHPPVYLALIITGGLSVVTFALAVISVQPPRAFVNLKRKITAFCSCCASKRK